MTSLVAPPRFRTKAAVLKAVPPPEPGERFVFDDVDWSFYEQVLRAVGDRRIFVTYFRGILEVMSPSYEHDWSAERLSMLIRIVCDELDVEVVGAGSTTFRRRRVSAGLEPDRGFYIGNVKAILGKRRIDLNSDPPPDLAIEVEISRRIGERQSVYEALRVPELWRYSRRGLRVLQLSVTGRYLEQGHSAAFPALPLEQVHHFVQMGWEMDDVTWGRAVRRWIRRNLRKGRSGRRRSRTRGDA
jgi:Uma2 family endonuclease